jgi:hypothetical protein
VLCVVEYNRVYHERQKRRLLLLNGLVYTEVDYWSTYCNGISGLVCIIITYSFTSYGSYQFDDSAFKTVSGWNTSLYPLHSIRKSTPILPVKSLITIFLLVVRRLLKILSNLVDLSFGIHCQENLKLLQNCLLLSDCLNLPYSKLIINSSALFRYLALLLLPAHCTYSNDLKCLLCVLPFFVVSVYTSVM